MAKATFNCAECGASVTIVGRNRSEADRKAKWHEAQGHICQECENKRRAEENDKAALANKELGLPALTGSEKQTAWAETIRNDTLALADKIGQAIAVAKSSKHLKSLSENARAARRCPFSRSMTGASRICGATSRATATITTGSTTGCT